MAINGTHQAKTNRPLIAALKKFFKLQSLGGVLLILTTLMALVVRNSSLAAAYQKLLEIEIKIEISRFIINTDFLSFVNNGLMTLFFFLVGLEIKRGLIQGKLARGSQLLLPSVAALGGMVVPAALYVIFNINNHEALHGWAIPTATDIAFSLAVLSLLEPSVPLSLKMFLTTLAIVDDLAAILIIALFYHSSFSIIPLLVAFAVMLLLYFFNRVGIHRSDVYILSGLLLWGAIFKSGIHSTLAGVILAFFIPISEEPTKDSSVLERIEEILHQWVMFAIVPLFAFCNAGVDLSGITFSHFLDSVSLGIIVGLFLGKQLGVFSFSWLAIKCDLAQLPKDTNWRQLYGVAILTGIGFTMSLFIGNLAFHTGSYYQTLRLGVITGSLLSALLGYMVLVKASNSTE
ncbi:MAG TPA: Na+/H+ antiporter NhaA [Oligoflexia bacterium]|nr:Na+/H+ antiporter NhaA [Oligoflexia bacterium]HMP27033.1 Na+/H+ antiporter NhaA [Oligoflexia bacterium]